MSKVKRKNHIIIGVCLAFLFIAACFNREFEVYAFHLSRNVGTYELKVITWNVHCPHGADNKRQETIAALILKEDANIILLNEFILDSCLVLDSIMRRHYPYKNDAGAMVMAGDICYSKIPLAESGRLLFNGFYNTLYSKINIGKDSVYIVGCHLDGNNYEGQIEIDDTVSLRRVKTFWGRYRRAQEKRKEHVHLLKKVIRESSLPMIVMGDMNDFQCSAPMDSLRDAGMKNAWWEGGLGYGATYHQGLLRLRIDHIYYNNRLKLESIKVIETKLSDHNPVVASFSLIKE